MVKPGIYEHFKGKKYKVLGIAKNTETRDELVVYRNISDETELWARPVEMFKESIEKDGEKTPRFSFIE